MAKEKFLIVAVPAMEDCFGRFSETANREAIDNGTADPTDPYSWIEGSFEIVLVRDKEATHICSLTPSAWQVFLQNEFVGVPNEAWEYDGDPEGLEHESGGEYGSYGTYRDEYDPRFICETFTVDSMQMDKPMRKPRDTRYLDQRGDRHEAYHRAIWNAAEEIASDLLANGVSGAAPILDVFEFRRWQKEQLEKRRQYHPNRFEALIG